MNQGSQEQLIDFQDTIEAVGLLEIVDNEDEDEFIEHFNQIAVEERDSLPSPDKEIHPRFSPKVGTTYEELKVTDALDQIFETVYLRGHSSTNRLTRVVIYGVIDKDEFRRRRELKCNQPNYIYNLPVAGYDVLTEIEEALSNYISDQLPAGLFYEHREEWAQGSSADIHPSFWSFNLPSLPSDLTSLQPSLTESGILSYDEELYWMGVDSGVGTDIEKRYCSYSDKPRLAFPGRKTFTTSIGAFKFRSIFVNLYPEGENSQYSDDGKPIGSLFTRRGYSNLSMVYERLFWALHLHFSLNEYEPDRFEIASSTDFDYDNARQQQETLQNERDQLRESWAEFSLQTDSIIHSLDEYQPFGEQTGFIKSLTESADDIEAYATRRKERLINRYTDLIQRAETDIDINSTIENIDLQYKIGRLTWFVAVLTVFLFFEALGSALGLFELLSMLDVAVRIGILVSILVFTVLIATFVFR